MISAAKALNCGVTAVDNAAKFVTEPRSDSPTLGLPADPSVVAPTPVSSSEVAGCPTFSESFEAFAFRLSSVFFVTRAFLLTLLSADESRSNHSSSVALRFGDERIPGDVGCPGRKTLLAQSSSVLPERSRPIAVRAVAWNSESVVPSLQGRSLWR